jgi:hypothetical protein
MDPRVKNFIERHRVLALSVLLKDGKPYTAVCHYAFNSDGHFIILTEKTTRKCSGLDFSKLNPASIAIGFSEEEWVEFQATGIVAVIPVQSPMYEGLIKNYEEKFKTTLHLDENDVFLLFDLKEARYMEFKRDPMVVINI